ncbi:MAG: 4'-phosphopantetheinyl transferase superfamily protein [Bacteroidota bacterium]
MIGFDLIAWPPQLPSQLGSSRWAQKVLGPEEWTCYQQHAHLRWYVAQCWAAKEAQFKLLCQLGQASGFKPKALPLPNFPLKLAWQTSAGRQDPPWHALGDLPAPSSARSGFLMALSSLSEVNWAHLAVYVEYHPGLSPASRSERLAEQLITFWSEQTQEPKDTWSLQKEANGLPKLWHRGKVYPLAFSLSHDGPWLGMAINCQV